MIITQTPFRMSFFGGGTDFSGFYNEHGGAVISTTFDKYCYVTVRHLPRFFDYKTHLSYSQNEQVDSYDEIKHPAIRNAMKWLDMHEIRLTYESDLPARSKGSTQGSENSPTTQFTLNAGCAKKQAAFKTKLRQVSAA